MYHYFALFLPEVWSPKLAAGKKFNAMSAPRFEDFTVPRTGPRSFLFYIVAKIHGLHRPLGVVMCLNIEYLALSDILTISVEGDLVIGACLRLMNIFSDPANRTIIQAEMALAADFYRQQENPLVMELPRLKPWRLLQEHSKRRWCL